MREMTAYIEAHDGPERHKKKMLNWLKELHSMRANELVNSLIFPDLLTAYEHGRDLLFALKKRVDQAFFTMEINELLESRSSVEEVSQFMSEHERLWRQG
jgi:hypothetical protein